MVAFRGSRSIKNWVSNLAVTLWPVKEWVAWCKDCKVHQGFWEAWGEVKWRVKEAVEQQQKAYPGYKIVTVGHSLGGAVAQLAAADMRTGGKSVTAVSPSHPHPRPSY